MDQKINTVTALNALSLEDSPRDFEILRELLMDAGYDLHMDRVDTEKEFTSILRSRKYDVILADFKLPGFDAFAALRLSIDICPDTPFICVSGTVGEETAVELLKQGAVDYVLKDRLERLPLAVKRALDESNEKRARRSAENALRESEAQLKESQRLGRIGSWEFDVVKNTIIWSEQTFFLYERDPRLGPPTLDEEERYYSPEQAKILRDDAARAISSGKEFSCDLEVKLPSGKTAWFTTAVQPYKNDLGQVIKLSGTVQDITERKHAEEELRRSEKRYRGIFENVQDVYYETTVEGTILEVSPSIEVVSKGQYPRDDLIGKSMWDFYADSGERQALIKMLLEHGKVTDFEVMLKNRDGSQIPCSISSLVLFDDKGRPEKIIGSMRDIARRKQAEDELHKLNAELEQRVSERTTQLEAANKDLESFVSSISHDLRAPLRAIDGFSSILLEDYAGKLDDEGKQLLNNLRANTLRMNRLISDLLVLSRSMNTDIQITRIDMTALAQLVYGEVASPEVKERFEFFLSPLPASQGDLGLLQQVWTNLLTNAIKFTVPKDVRRIEVGGYTENDRNVYFVKDSGVGFNPKYTHKLFRIFQRLHSFDEFEGTGIGLAIVHRIVDRHNGQVWAEGKVGEGAVFYFSLPVESGQELTNNQS
jgi:PAS domain S-box-containing protein